jgi:hypothetical protein
LVSIPAISHLNHFAASWVINYSVARAHRCTSSAIANLMQTRLIKSVLGVISCITTFRCASQFTNFNCALSAMHFFISQSSASLDSNSFALSHWFSVYGRMLLIHRKESIHGVFCTQRNVSASYFSLYI